MIEFLLGATIITLIYQGVKLNKVSKQVEDLKGNENEITTWIQRNDESINNRIDQEINRNDRHFTDVVEYINQNLQQKENKKKFLKG
jgi:uncharacterized protein (DUF111 family)